MSTRFGPKHQCRVNECYPQSTGEVGVVSSKLSALVYYINARPSKLLKVSAYLERKAVRDVTRESACYNAITLDIVLGVMRGCSDYFSTFAPTVLRLLHIFAAPDIVASRSPELATRIHNVFAEFCRMSKGVIPSIRDGEFFEMLTDVQARVLALASYTAGQCTINGMEVARSLQAAIAMEDFRAPRGEARIGQIVHCIVRQFYDSQLDASVLKSDDLTSRSSAQRQAIPQTVDYQIGTAFVSLVEGANSETVPVIVSSLFAEFDQENWMHQRLCTGLLGILVIAVPAQFLCVVLSDFFRRLERTMDDSQIITLTTTIADLLLSNRSPLGYSATELASNFLRLLRRQRPSASQEPRASFAEAKVQPPRDIFAICSAFVSLLRNANFALQRFEVIEHIITKTYFPKDSIPLPSSSSSALMATLGNVPFSTEDGSLRMERHTMGTIILNSIEESHLQSVVWGILNALAEEASPPSALRLAFAEVHASLFEKLFQMSLSADPELCLNALVLWRRLIENGLYMSPPRRNTARIVVPAVSSLSPPSSTRSEHSANDSPVASHASPPGGVVTVLGRTGTYLMTKSRAVISAVCRMYGGSVLHYGALFALMGKLLRECDTVQLIHLVRQAIWLHESSTVADNMTFEDRACISMLACMFLAEAGRFGSLQSLAELGDSCVSNLRSHGMKTLLAADVLSAGWRGPDFERYEEFYPASVVPSFDDVRKAILSDLPAASNSLQAIESPYSPGMDATALHGLQPSSEKSVIGFGGFRDATGSTAGNRNGSSLIYRLSRAGSGIQSGVHTVHGYGRISNDSGPYSGLNMPFASGRLGRIVSLTEMSAFNSQTSPAYDPMSVTMTVPHPGGVRQTSLLSSEVADDSWAAGSHDNLLTTPEAPPSGDNAESSAFAAPTHFGRSASSASRGMLTIGTPGASSTTATTGYIAESDFALPGTMPQSSHGQEQHQFLDVHFDELETHVREQRRRREGRLTMILRSSASSSSVGSIANEGK